MDIMFPGVTHVKISSKKSERSVVVSYSDLKEKLSEEDFKRLSNDIFLLGKFEDSKHIVTISQQRFEGPYNDTFI